MRRAYLVVMLGGLLASVPPSHAEEAPRFDIPIRCDLGETCFLQQYPDMDAGPGISDPYCGGATYDGHKGTDIRVRYLDDIKDNVPVLAAAKGTVLRLRDGVVDQLVRSEADRAAVADTECGNGLVVDHGNGWETQYCHLKQGSLAVREGETVEAGTPLGAVGASGLAQFPHVHLSVRKDGKEVDPFTGRPLGSECIATRHNAGSLWSSDAAALIQAEATQVLDLGLAPGPVDHETLVVSRPAEALRSSAALVGWASLINLQKGDRITISVVTPGGQVFAEQMTDPLDRNKASYSLFAGRKGSPSSGQYRVSVKVLRDGRPVTEIERDVSVN